MAPKQKKRFLLLLKYPDGTSETVEVHARDYASAIDEGLEKRRLIKVPLTVKLRESREPTYIC